MKASRRSEKKILLGLYNTAIFGNELFKKRKERLEIVMRIIILKRKQKLWIQADSD